MSVAALAARLPDPATLERWCVALAVLDVVMYDQPDMRYHQYDSHWSDTERHASMSDGGGDEYSIIFSPAGTYIRGFDHESALSPWTNDPPSVVSGLTDNVPAALRQYVDEPAFTVSDVPSISGWADVSRRGYAVAAASRSSASSARASSLCAFRTGMISS